MSQLHKTRICAYHLKGSCQFGSKCSFAHSCTELQSVPDLSKTRLCQAYQEGNCDKKDCSFAHGEEELRTTDLFYKKALCIWHMKGRCRSGNQCRFAHGSAELRTKQERREDEVRSGRAMKQAAAIKVKDESFKEEPMKVQPARLLAAPLLCVPGKIGLPTEVDTLCDVADFGQPFAVGEPEMLCDSADFGQPFALGMPTPPGLDWLEDGVNAMMEAESAAGTWWHWPGGYDIAPNMMADFHVLGNDIESMRPSSDLDRLHEDIVSFQQKLQMLEQGSSNVGFPAEYFKLGSGSDLDFTSEGSTAGGLDPQLPMYWGA